MNGINQRCVSLASGVLSPDLRVNYEFGLVLGVDEFKQEQMYFLEKDYLHNRALHGYGTVYGLKVEATRPADDLKDLLITIEPGLGIDQCGRPILLRNAQCARLKAWLKKQPANVVTQHSAASGMHLYVVASYDECLEALVPIPGAPCSSSESASAPSRIRDSFNLELRWEPPRMAAWDAVDLFARLMGHVRFVPHLPQSDSDEGRIITLVRELDNPATVLLLPGSEFFLDSPPLGSPPDSPPGSPPESPPAGEPFLRLPRETAHEALDRIFTVWVTEVRPRIQPSLSDQCSPAMDAGILLSRIDFGLGNPSLDIIDPGVPDDTGRPFLLHTQLIQELLFHGGDEINVTQKSHEFATLQVRDGHTLRAWIHHPDQLVFSPDVSNNPGQALRLKSDGVQLAIDGVKAVVGLANVFDIVTNIKSPIMEEGAEIELAFLLNELQAQNGGSLQAIVATLTYAYIGHDPIADTITVYTIAERPPSPQEFVTFNTILSDRGTPMLTAWFHTQEPVTLPQQISAIPGLVENNNAPVTFNTSSGASPSSLWNLNLQDVASLADKTFLSFNFNTDDILVGAGNVSLTTFIQKQQLPFIGYDGDHTIQAFYEVNVPSRVTQRSPSLFVTITPGTLDQAARLGFELWFHLDLDPSSATVQIVKLPSFNVFAEPDIRNPLNVIQLTPVPGHANVFTGLLRGFKPEEQRYLRFLFSVDETRVNVGTTRATSLRAYINNSHINFEGYDGGKFIVAYMRVPVPVPVIG